MSSDGKRNVIVIGAGVVGLTTALTLLQRGTYAVTIIAKHLPGDQHDATYASPSAGANWWPVSAAGTREADWEAITIAELWRLAHEVPAAGVEARSTVIYKRRKDVGSDTAVMQWTANLLSDAPWFADLPHTQFRVLAPQEVPPQAGDAGTAFRSVCANPAIFLPWLLGQCLARGAVVRRGTVRHVRELGMAADVVVNCTGLMARQLGGVMDTAVVPVRGQIVVVRNEAPVMVDTSSTDDGGDELTYIMMRGSGGGTVIGGCYQKDNWNAEVDPAMTQRIMKRAVEICPQLVKPGEGTEGLDVIKTYVGFRPLRIGGVRLEKEVIDGVKVVHNYGAAGFGYQASYGMAEYAARLVDEATKAKAQL